MNEAFYLEILAHRWHTYQKIRAGLVWGFNDRPKLDSLSELPDFVVSMYWILPDLLRPNLQYAVSRKDKLESMVLAWDKLATCGIKCEPEPYIRYGDCS